jgi:hypothetical protein
MPAFAWVLALCRPTPAHSGRQDAHARNGKNQVPSRERLRRGIVPGPSSATKRSAKLNCTCHAMLSRASEAEYPASPPRRFPSMARGCIAQVTAAVIARRLDSGAGRPAAEAERTAADRRGQPVGRILDPGIVISLLSAASGEVAMASHVPMRTLVARSSPPRRPANGQALRSSH